MAFDLNCNVRPSRMRRTTALCFFILSAVVAQTAFAQQVYKWVDSNGKVQYGEKRNAPTASQAVNIKPIPSTGTPSVTERKSEQEKFAQRISPPPSAILDRIAMPKSEKWPEFKISMPAKSGQNENILALGEAVLQSCVSLAVKLNDLEFSPEKTAIHNQYLKTCPGVREECISYRKAPEQNICEPKSMGAEKSITVFRSYD